jgi:uncharacterized phage-associated protein
MPVNHIELDILEIADYLVEASLQKQTKMGQMKLQLILYYAQGWHLALYGQPLFQESFHKWGFGPASPKVTQAFKHFEAKSITAPSLPQRPPLPVTIQVFLDDIHQHYSHFNGMTLSNMVKLEDPFRQCPPEQTVIANEALQRFFNQQKLKAQSLIQQHSQAS